MATWKSVSRVVLGIEMVFFLLFLFSFSAHAQIDYSAHPETISSSNKIVRIDWLKSTPRNCQIDFNHLVNFINVKNDQMFNSKITVELYHNDELIRSFVFPTGDRITNRIYVGEAIKLRKGDSVYFLFKLLPTANDEEYVFNLYEEPRAAIKTVAVIKPKAEKENVNGNSQKSKPVKYKALSDRYFRKLQRQPIPLDM